MENDTLLGIVFSSVCGCGIVGGIGFLAVGTIFKLPFGVNLGRAECGRAAPTVRAPKDLYEMLLGGWTCGKCGCKNDKWGKPRNGVRRRKRKKKRDEEDED